MVLSERLWFDILFNKVAREKTSCLVNRGRETILIVTKCFRCTKSENTDSLHCLWEQLLKQIKQIKVDRTNSNPTVSYPMMNKYSTQK
jgi:hypothetical protein